jgi:indolepyruvate ferredoxin oxidoreductase
LLTAYQDAAYAARYRAVVQSVAVAESARLKGMTGLAETAARTLYRLMAYKDEYEVARLYSDPAFRRSLEAQFEGDYRIEFNLAPPLFAKRDPTTGRLIKRSYGPWLLPVFRVMAKMKRLRGTMLDPFGHTQERRMERRLITEYESLLRTIIASLTLDNHALAMELAGAAERVRGYGHIKQQSVAQVKATEARLLARLQKAELVLAAAE